MVLFVHGILSTGFWMNTMRPLFEAEGLIAKPIGFHVFDLFRFLFGFRRPAIDKVSRQIKNMISANPHAELTIIAHSFGTYVVSRILEEDFGIKLTRLILCGGIVPRNYRWDKVARFNSQNAAGNVDIVNEFSSADRWPILARHSTYGYGDVGTIGCQDIHVRDRRHYIPHSGYLKASFAQDHWIPFFNPAPRPLQPGLISGSSWLLALNWLPARMISFVIVGLLAFGIYFVLDRATYRTIGTFRIPNTSNVTFEVRGYKSKGDRNPEVVYSARNSSAAGLNYSVHDLASDNKYATVVVNVTYRRIFDCRPSVSNPGAVPLEDIGSEQLAAGFSTGAQRSGNQVATTKFTLDLSKAYRAFGRAKLDFAYNDNAALADYPAFRADKLIVFAGGRLDHEHIKVDEVEHSSDIGTCADNGKVYEPGISPFVETAAVKDEPQGFLTSLFGKVWAAESIQPLTADNIETLLGDPSPERRAIAVDAIIASPDRFSKRVRLIAESSSNTDAVVEVLRASRNVLPRPIRLDENRVMQLAIAGSPKVRDAARSYLRAPNVVSGTIAQLFEGASFKELLAELRQKPVERRPYFQDYLLLITARDVFYNLGLKELAPILDKIRKNEELAPGEQESLLKRFDAGIALRELARTSDESIALSKNSYGKALALLELAINREAASNTSKLGVFEYIGSAMKAQKPLADSTARTQVAAQFGKFLDEVDGKPSLYPWPLHIEQATRCRENPAFACLAAPNAQ